MTWKSAARKDFCTTGEKEPIGYSIFSPSENKSKGAMTWSTIWGNKIAFLESDLGMGTVCMRARFSLRQLLADTLMIKKAENGSVLLGCTL